MVWPWEDFTEILQAQQTGKAESERGSHHLKPNAPRKTRRFGRKADRKMVVEVMYIMAVEVALKRSGDADLWWGQQRGALFKSVSDWWKGE